jgi:ATP-dependent RNA helicase RhlE
MTTFNDFGLIPAIQESLAKKGYTHPTPVQAKAIPEILRGKDVFALAQTGTGKTASFALPILQHLATAPFKKGIRVLILAPTRELAIQIHTDLEVYGSTLNIKAALIYGGVSQHRQEQSLHQHPSIVVATPGRLLDLFAQGHIHFKSVEIIVLDECDRMLDMGFARDLNKIMNLVPKQRQTLLLSATMPAEIRKLADQYLNDPVTIEIKSETKSPVLIEQVMYYIDRENRGELLVDLMHKEKIDQVLIFTRTKRGADRLAKILDGKKISAMAIHGDKSQNQRERSLELFKAGKLRALVATDLASRGIDVKELSHVINFDMPGDVETYIHRIGRTGRAGNSGMAISFRGIDDADIEKDLLKVHGNSLEVIREHEYFSGNVFKPLPPKQERPPRNKSNPKAPAKPKQKSNSKPERRFSQK